MRLRRIEVVEAEDGGGVLTVTAVGTAGEEVVFRYTGKLTYGFNTRAYGFAHLDLTVTPQVTPGHDSEKRNNPTSKYP